MPLKELRGVSVGARGYRAVTYVTAAGKTRRAKMVSDGASSGVKLKVGSLRNLVVDNVAKATGNKQASTYRAR